MATACSLTDTPSAVTSPTAAVADCGPSERMLDLGHEHITTPTHEYPQHPATSGPHNPIWMMPPPQVFTTVIPETRAVHNLEHGYVIAYYSEALLPPSVVAALAVAVKAERKVLLAPYAQLPTGSALAFAAWDELQLCRPEVTADAARSALKAFVTNFREGPLAPEPNSP